VRINLKLTSSKCSLLNAAVGYSIRLTVKLLEWISSSKCPWL